MVIICYVGLNDKGLAVFMLIFFKAYYSFGLYGALN